ncbi:hypothetical protein, partial [Kitasatospora sp. NPDC056181]|uniref:hypothetical protein n=1 Tax=Kitasatospora sp. NPDC056181 TaxID=3345737 RepID=UPI0035E3A9FA
MTDPGRTVDLNDLTLGTSLGKGGHGTVRLVQGRTVDGEPAVYKEYLPEVLPSLDVAALRAMVDLPVGLAGEDTRWLLQRTAWPAALVTRHGAATGFLMRKVPDEFAFDYQGLSPSGSGRRLANFEFLLNRDDYVAGIGLKITPRHRLNLLAGLAETLDRLHGLGIAVGDLSPRNVLFTNGAGAASFLIDCDAMRVHGRSALPQAETPGWQLPPGEEKATRHGDAFKFGLLAIRLIAREQGATDPQVLARVDRELADLARRSQLVTPSGRPAPGEWVLPLRRAAVRASTKPATTSRPIPRPPSGTASPGLPGPG